MLQSQRAALASTQHDSVVRAEGALCPGNSTHMACMASPTAHTAPMALSLQCVFTMCLLLLFPQARNVFLSGLLQTSSFMISDWSRMNSWSPPSLAQDYVLFYIEPWCLGLRSSLFSKSIFTKNDSALYLWQSLIRATYSRISYQMNGYDTNKSIIHVINYIVAIIPT